MLVFLPILLLLAAALAGFLLQLLKKGIGYFWAIAFIATLTVWVTTLVIPTSSVQPVALQNWLPFTQIFTGLSFQIEPISSTFSFCIASLLLAFVITSTLRLQKQSHTRETISMLILGSLGILVMVSGNPLTLVLSWSLFDFVTFVVEIGSANENGQRRKPVFAFAIKLLGTMVLLSGIILVGGKGVNFDLTNIPMGLSFIVALSAIFRLWGSLYSFDVTKRDSEFVHSAIIHLISFSTGLALLTRIPISTHLEIWQTWTYVGVILLAAWAVFRSLQTQDLRKGLSFFLTGGVSLAIFCAINGQPLAALAWGCLFILIGGNLSLFEKFYRYQMIIPFLGILLGIGLPFTLGSLGWVGIFSQNFLVGFLLLICFAGCTVGMVLGVLKSEIRTEQFERPIAFVHLIGISILVISEILLSFRFIENLYSTRYVFAPIIVIAIIGIVVLLVPRIHVKFQLIPNLKTLMEKYPRLQTGLRGKFIVPLLKGMINLVDRLIQIITLVLEGEGGVIWTLVLLAVLISVLGPGGK